MGLFCPQKNLKDWKDLVKAQGLELSYFLWNEYEGVVPREYYEIKEPTRITSEDIQQQIISPKGLSFEDIENVSNFIVNKLEKVKSLYNPKIKFVPAHSNFFGKHPDSYEETKAFKNKIKDISNIFRELVGYHEPLQEYERNKVYDEIEFLINNKIEDYWIDKIKELNSTESLSRQKLKETYDNINLLYDNINLLNNFFKHLKVSKKLPNETLLQFDEKNQETIKKLVPKMFDISLGNFKSINQKIAFTERNTLKRLRNELDDYKKDVQLDNFKRFKRSALIKKYNTLLNFADIIPDWKQRLIQYVYDYEKNILGAEHTYLTKIKEKNEEILKQNESEGIFIDKILAESLKDKLLQHSTAEKEGVLNLNTQNIQNYFSNLNFGEDVISETTALNALSSLEKLHPEYKKIIEILKPFAEKYNVKIELVYDTNASYAGINKRNSNITEETNEEGHFKVDISNSIIINMAAAVVRETPHKTLLHEIVHSFSNVAIAVDPELNKFISKIIDKINKDAGNNSVASMLGYGIYGLSNSDEFIAEFFSNKDFQEYLKNIKPIESENFKNVFSEIVNKIFTTIQDILNRLVKRNVNISQNLYEQLQPLLESIFSYQEAMVTEGIYTEKNKSINEAAQLHIQQPIKEGVEEDITSSFRSMEMGDSLAREYEQRMGLWTKNGKKLIFDTIAKRDVFFKKVPQSLKDEIRQYFEIVPSKTMRGNKGVYGEYFTFRLERKSLRTVVDSTYGEFNKDEADVVKSSLLPQDNNSLTTVEVIEALKASGLINNEVLDLLADINVPIEFVELEGNTLFDTDGTVIRVNVNKLSEAHPQLVAEGIVHELVHIKTVNALENPQSEAEKFLSKRAKYLFNSLKKHDKEGKYGFTNEVEFVAELLAKPSFREYVKSLENGNIWRKFVSFLAEFFGIKTGSERLIKDLEDYISKNNLTSDKFTTKRMEIINTTSKLLADIIDNVGTRIKATEARLLKQSEGKLSTHQQELLDKQKILLDELLDKGNNAKALHGILSYLETINSYREDFVEKVGEIRESVENGGNDSVFYKGSVIKSLGNFIYGNTAILEKLNTNIKDIKSENPELTTEIENIDKLIKELIVDLGRLKKDYIDISRVVFAKFLLPFGMGRTLDHIEKVLSEPVEDIGFFTRWLDNLQQSGDEALGMIDAALKHHYIQAQLESESFKVEMIQLKEKLEKAGIRDVEFMIKVDSKGKRTHYFVTERDIVRYKELVKETFDKLPNPENTPDPEETFKNNIKIQSEFYRKHTVSSKFSPNEYNELLRIKKEELGENFEAWFEANSITNPTDGNIVIPLVFDKTYKDIQSNPLKSEYYWKVLNNKLNGERHLPASKRHLRRLPQIRKDFIERVKDGNWNRMYEGIKEGFQIKEDDTSYGTKFGLTDERGRVIQFLPVYFVDKIPNADDISPDITSTIIAHNYHYTRRDKLSLIVDLLEIGKDVIKDRGVYKKSRGQIIESVKKFTGTKRTSQIVENDSELLKRLQTYLDMFVYGEMHKEGVKVMGIDIEKAADRFGGYVWLRQLALNVYATVANLTTGEALAAMETINSKYFDKNSLLYAEKTLELGLSGILFDVGKRLPSRKLTLWSEEMDSMNNYEEKIFNLNAERKTKLGKVVTGSGFGFMSRMVEFRLHNKISLAVANTYRYDKNTKSFVFKNEFFKEVEDLKNKKAYELKKLRQEQKNKIDELTKQGRTSEIQELKNKYQVKMLEIAKSKDDAAIKTLEDKLNKQWSEMPKWYDSHEVKNNKLVLKKDIEVSNYNEIKTRFINRQHGVNNNLQGMYAKLDKSAFQQKAIGRMVSMYRKWLMPAFNRRFAKKQTDFELQMETEGYYRAFGRFMKEIAIDIKEHQFSLYKNWNTLTKEEKASVLRVFGDITFMLALSVLISALSGDDDDEDTWAMNMLIYQTNRLFTEYGAITPPFAMSEVFKILESPAAGVNVGQELYDLITMNPFKGVEEIEKGKYKGMTRYEKSLIRTFPMAETLYGLQFPEEKVKYYSSN